MNLNIFSLSATERKKRQKFHCIHRNNGLYHPNCYNKHYKIEPEKIGFLDIETSNLSSDFGIILCYAIRYGNKTISNSITPAEIKAGSYDKRLLTDLCKDLRKFNRVITWYGYKFDIPYCRSRAILHKLDFPIYKEVYHTDAYQKAKILIRTLHSKRLGVVASFYGIKAKEHSLNPTIWLKCLSGDTKALRFVQTHCDEDVYSLQQVWDRVLLPYVILAKSSI